MSFSLHYFRIPAVSNGQRLFNDAGTGKHALVGYEHTETLAVSNGELAVLNVQLTKN